MPHSWLARLFAAWRSTGAYLGEHIHVKALAWLSSVQASAWLAPSLMAFGTAGNQFAAFAFAATFRIAAQACPSVQQFLTEMSLTNSSCSHCSLFEKCLLFSFDVGAGGVIVA